MFRVSTFGETGNEVFYLCAKIFFPMPCINNYNKDTTVTLDRVVSKAIFRLAERSLLFLKIAVKSQELKKETFPNKQNYKLCLD